MALIQIRPFGRYVVWIAGCLLMTTWFGCAGKKVSSMESVQPNIAYLEMKYSQAWELTLNTVAYDFLLPIEIQDIKRGYFTTQVIFQSESRPKSKFRLSGNLSSNNAETMITLYKQEEIQDENGLWQTIGSDYELEKQIIERIKEKFSQAKR